MKTVVDSNAMDSKNFFWAEKISFLLFLVFITTLGSCNWFGNDPKSELEKLPPSTQQGKNTFGCLVNGKAWVTRTSTDVLAFYQSGLFQVGAGVDNELKQGMTIVVSNGIVEGSSYNLANELNTKVEFSSRSPLRICFYDRYNTINGKLTITKLDQTKLIVSGLFEFTTVVAGCDTIMVTDGRFDVLYAN